MVLSELAAQAGTALQQCRCMLATAESCTGGWVAREITSIPGSSRWYERGFITYTNRSKQEMLGVQAATLEQFGAVSMETVREMAEGALLHSQAQVSLAISGIAGPEGGQEGKPVGTVCFAWAREGWETLARIEHFPGDREQVREQAVAVALSGLLGFLGAR